MTINKTFVDINNALISAYSADNTGKSVYLLKDQNQTLIRGVQKIGVAISVISYENNNRIVHNLTSQDEVILVLQ